MKGINVNHDTTSLLSLKGISKSYDGQAVLTDFSMDFTSGTYCLMAPSGSGKTTLFRLILGLETADFGTISFTLWEGEGKDSQKPVRPQISAVFQDDRLLEAYNPVENLRFIFGNHYSGHKLEEYVRKLLPNDSLNKPVREFSGGMKRRLSILCALLSPAHILLMDEPFTGLDGETKRTVIRLILSLCPNKLLIVSTHDPEDLSLLQAKLVTLP